MPEAYYLLLDENGKRSQVARSEIATSTYAPHGDYVVCASRFETHDGRVFWSEGFRGWYHEHALQGGLRVIRHGVELPRA